MDQVDLSHLISFKLLNRIRRTDQSVLEWVEPVGGRGQTIGGAYPPLESEAAAVERKLHERLTTAAGPFAINTPRPTYHHRWTGPRVWTGGCRSRYKLRTTCSINNLRLNPDEMRGGSDPEELDHRSDILLFSEPAEGFGLDPLRFLTFKNLKP